MGQITISSVRNTMIVATYLNFRRTVSKNISIFQCPVFPAPLFSNTSFFQRQWVDLRFSHWVNTALVTNRVCRDWDGVYIGANVCYVPEQFASIKTQRGKVIKNFNLIFQSINTLLLFCTRQQFSFIKKWRPQLWTVTRSKIKNQWNRSLLSAIYLSHYCSSIPDKKACFTVGQK